MSGERQTGASGQTADRALIARIVRAGAENAAAQARVLARQDPSWNTRVLPLAGGWLVLGGQGMYVNEGIGLGVTTGAGADEFEVIEQHSAAVGVPAALQVAPVTDPHLAQEAAARGYVDGRTTRYHARPLSSEDGAVPVATTLTFETVSSATLHRWQEAAAQGFGALEGRARRASDAFASAALVTDTLVLAVDRADGRPLGCASLTVADGIATLGGMATVPAERNRGVQAALIAHRLTMAVEAGCDIAVSSAEPGSGSSRNLVRAGLPWLFDVTTLVRREQGSGP